VEAIDEIVAEFLVESHENLDQLDRDLLALEQDPGSPELLAGVFRTIHTIKGTSGFLAFGRLERLTHIGENLLSGLRDGRIALTDARSTALLQTVDAIRGVLAEIEASGSEGNPDHTALLATLSALLEDGAEPAAPPIGAVLLEAGARPAAVESVPDSQAEAHIGGHRSVVEGSVRVDVGLLDSLLRLVGELALARDELFSCVADGQDATQDARRDSLLARTAQRLDVVTTQLQEHVLKTRMQPVDAVWSKMPRVVGHLARTCGRQVRLELEGGETALDRSVLEAIKDPLTHLVRNAVDHGIESPEDRVRAGKPAEGVLTLRAYQESGQLHLEVSEDGAGMDPGRIAAKALERGLVTPAQIASMSSREVLDLIFVPGFSTAPAVTHVSGRGVGLDVVKNRIEAIGGSVAVRSRVGEGSTIRLTIPVRLAIVPVATSGARSAR
jgi:two-component system chemotaxis sensor kinase CheA